MIKNKQLHFILFYHSLVSDWNHGNAHFLRGIVRELQKAGHRVTVYEPQNGWSRRNLLDNFGEDALMGFHEAFPGMETKYYDLAQLNLDQILDGADVVLVHEWNESELVSKIGDHKSRGSRYILLFHDTHHRALSRREEIARFDLKAYDGVLAFGNAIKDIYLENGWSGKVWTWHEAADIELFRPLQNTKKQGDVVWIGNWGDNERTTEIQHFFVDPVRELGLTSTVFGVRYPNQALEMLHQSGCRYNGWLPNHRVPEVFAKFTLTVHIPRRPYVEALPGIPTIRVFEALACGIPLICSPWSDAENLFRPGQDYLLVQNKKEMKEAMLSVLHDRSLIESLRQSGLESIISRHTCRHRVEELLSIIAQINNYPKTEH